MRTGLRLPKAQCQALLDALLARGFEVFGPVAHDGVVGFAPMHRVSELPAGLCDVQGPGRYRLEDDSTGLLFSVVNGPGSLKPLFFAPEEPLLKLRRDRRGFRVEDALPATRRLAVIGVRPCDLAAVEIQDRIFLNEQVRDAHYAARREHAFLIAVNCTRAVSTCFCASMRTGPGATTSYDFALTELEEVFVLDSRSSTGDAIAVELALVPASTDEIDEAKRRIAACAGAQERRLDTSDLPDLLHDEAANTHWADIGRRCLSCTSCTMVCPTCFCHTVVDETSLDGSTSQRVRHWDSCHNLEHAHIRGKNFRPHTAQRYRQWLTHKLTSWIAQFGTSGCVGCGRCITWCPVEIDLTAEVQAIRAARALTYA